MIHDELIGSNVVMPAGYFVDVAWEDAVVRTRLEDFLFGAAEHGLLSRKRRFAKT
jgi:hypothetical protein